MTITVKINNVLEVNETRDITCYSAAMITTDGIWQKDNPLHYSLPLFILQVMLVVTTTHLFVFLLKPIRQPRVIAEILGGVILGPSVLGKSKAFHEIVFPSRGVLMLETMGNVGILYFIFLVGVGTNTSALKRIGRKAVIIAVAGMVLPFAIGAVFTIVLIEKSGRDQNLGAVLVFLGVVLSITAFPVLARILAELKLMNTEIGKVAVSAALVNDACAWLLLAVSVTMVEKDTPTLTPLMIFLATSVFVAFNVFAVRPMILMIIRNTPEGESFCDFHICMILAGVMISGFITDVIGTHSILGAFIFGLTIPNGPLGFALVERLEDFISGIFLPLFFANSGLKTDLGLLKSFRIWAILLLLAVLSCIGKIGGTMAAAVYYQMSVSEGAVLGLLMNTKGLVEVLVLNIGKEQNVLSDHSFTGMVVMTILMTGIIVPGVTALYKPSHGFISYKRRTIQMSKRDAEFRILVCLHTPRNVPTVINLLEASNPTELSPICIYALHLVELSGHTSAIRFLNNSRKSNQPTLDRNQAQTDTIFHAFQNYEQRSDHISVQPLTAVSPYSTIHEDICDMAQDKRVAFIIIPFHKQRTVDGRMEAINMTFRNINRNVLTNAPCSVGILVDRGFNDSAHLARDPMSHHVVVLFFGGPDDREALSYGWRMSEHPGIHLTVMHFLSGEEVMHENVHPQEPMVLTVETDKDIDKQLDEKFMNWFRTSQMYNNSVVYIEKVVNNGEQTVAAIRSLHDLHDLFIIGRGQGMVSPLTAGLTDWSECPELGAIGDLLASSDFIATASVLVVQQYVGVELEGDELGEPQNTGLTNEEYVNQISDHSTPPKGHNITKDS